MAEALYIIFAVSNSEFQMSQTEKKKSKINKTFYLLPAILYFINKRYISKLVYTWLENCGAW